MGLRKIVRCAFFAAITANVFSNLAAAPAEEPAAIRPAEVIKFIQGDKYEGLYTWLEHNKYEDPDKVFTVKDGVLHLTGKENGYICTKKPYKDYRLKLEYRWGDKTYGSRKTMARDSGIFFHCGPYDGTYLGQYPSSFEAQIIEGGTGDLELIPGKRPDGSRIAFSLACEVSDEPDYAGREQWKKGGRRVRLSEQDTWRISWFDHDRDWKNEIGYKAKNDLASPGKEWTRLELVCDGGNVKYYVNGMLAIEAFDLEPSSGRIALQCEEAEMDFRGFELHPLEEDSR